MDEYTRKLEDENKRLVEELGRKEALISSTPFNSDIYITFGTDFEFDGTLCAFLARLSYAYVNPYTGSEENKHLKSYKQELRNPRPQTQNDNFIWEISKLLQDVNDDLRGFFNTNIQSFRTDPMTKQNPAEGLPWTKVTPWEIFFVSGLDETLLFELFRKQRILSMKPFNKINRWTRFKQFMKGI
jgi:hypothetical protein